VTWSVVMWRELTWFMWSDFILKLNEVSYVEVLGYKSTMHIRVTLYWLIVFEWRHPDVLKFSTKIIKYLLSNTSCLLCVRLHFSVLTWPSSGLFANRVNRRWLHVGIQTMLTIHTSILCLVYKCIKFKTKKYKIKIN